MVSPSVYWVDLNKVDLSENAPVYSINAYDTALNGDITGQLQQLSTVALTAKK